MPSSPCSADSGPPERDELDLLTLYAGYAASAVERDRLLEQVTARNRVLETIREMLETLAGPVPVDEGLAMALQSLRAGPQADEVGLLTWGEPPSGLACLRGRSATDPAAASVGLRDGRASRSADAAATARRAELAWRPRAAGAGRALPGARGPDRPVCRVERAVVTEEETALIEDAAHSLRLALEREEAGAGPPGGRRAAPLA